MSAKDDLANRFKADFDDLHDFVNSMPSGDQRRKARRLAAMSHAVMNELKAIAVDGNMISPNSGGDPKPEE